MGAVPLTCSSPPPREFGHSRTPVSIGQKYRDDDHCFDHVHSRGRNTRIALHRPRTGLEGAEQYAGRYDTERVEPSEERNGDGGESISR